MGSGPLAGGGGGLASYEGAHWGGGGGAGGGAAAGGAGGGAGGGAAGGGRSSGRYGSVGSGGRSSMESLPVATAAWWRRSQTHATSLCVVRRRGRPSSNAALVRFAIDASLTRVHAFGGSHGV